MKEIERMDHVGSINKYVKHEQSMLPRKHLRIPKNLDGMRARRRTGCRSRTGVRGTHHRPRNRARTGPRCDGLTRWHQAAAGPANGWARRLFSSKPNHWNTIMAEITPALVGQLRAMTGA